MTLLASNFDKSRYFRAADLETERLLRIRKVTEETLGIGADAEHKLVLWFTGDEERGLPLNKTNNRTLRGAFGDAVDGWLGKVIAVFPTMVDFRGRMIASLRVRVPAPKQAAVMGNGSTQAADPKPPAKPQQPTLAEDLNDEIPW